MLRRPCLRQGAPLRVVWLALSAALCAGLSSMGFKTVSSSVRLSIEGHELDQALGSPYPYLGMACTLVLAVSNVGLLNKAVEGAPATLSIPLYQVRGSAPGVRRGAEGDRARASTQPRQGLDGGRLRPALSYRLPQSLNVICAIAAGGLFYGEFEQLDTQRRVSGFVGGLLTSICGIVWLARSKRTPTAPTEPKPLLTDFTGATVRRTDAPRPRGGQSPPPPPATAHPLPRPAPRQVPVETLDEVLRQSGSNQLGTPPKSRLAGT